MVRALISLVATKNHRHRKGSCCTSKGRSVGEVSPVRPVLGRQQSRDPPAVNAQELGLIRQNEDAQPAGGKVGGQGEWRAWLGEDWIPRECGLSQTTLT